jgi:hypothetical protein
MHVPACEAVECGSKSWHLKWPISLGGPYAVQIEKADEVSVRKETKGGKEIR